MLATPLTRVTGLTLAAFICCGTLPLSGCVKTQDGSYELKNPPPVPTAFFARGERRLAQRRAEIGANAFPEAPPSLENRRVRQQIRSATAGWTPMVQTPSKPASVPGKALVCHDETSASGRVRVVCD